MIFYGHVKRVMKKFRLKLYRKKYTPGSIPVTKASERPQDIAELLMSQYYPGLHNTCLFLGGKRAKQKNLYSCPVHIV